jgi:hypothetical protein
VSAARISADRLAGVAAASLFARLEADFRREEAGFAREAVFAREEAVLALVREGVAAPPRLEDEGRLDAFGAAAVPPLPAAACPLARRPPRFARVPASLRAFVEAVAN